MLEMRAKGLTVQTEKKDTEQLLNSLSDAHKNNSSLHVLENQLSSKRQEFKNLQAKYDAIDVDIPEITEKVNVDIIRKDLADVQDYNRRCDNSITINKDIADLKARLAAKEKDLYALNLPVNAEKVSSFDIAEKSKRITDAEQSNVNIDKYNSIKSQQEAILKDQSIVKTDGESLSEQVVSFELIDVEAIQESIQDIEKNNEMAAKYNDHLMNIEEKGVILEQWRTITAERGDIEREKQEYIKSLDLPLELDVAPDGDLLHNGRPFDINNYNHAQLIEFTLQLLKTMYPETCLILLYDGSLYDDATIKRLVDLDFQVFIEYVGTEAPKVKSLKCYKVEK
jgi:hypothetical protein